MTGLFPRTEILCREPQPLIPMCGACGLFKNCKSPKMLPSGQGKQKVLLCAEAPGKDEDAEGIQLVGKAGKFLERMLSKIGVDMRWDCWLTNALICRPENNTISDPRMIDYCRPNLLKTIREKQPDVVILFGMPAVKSLIGHVWKDDIGDRLGRWTGWKIPCMEPNTWICPTWHPSYLVRENNPVLDRDCERHLTAAFELKGKPWATVPDYQSHVEVITDSDEAGRRIRAWLGRKPVVSAFDYETTTLKPDSDKAKIVSCSICFGGQETIAYPWHGAAIEATKDFLVSDFPKIASNMKFEQRWSMAKLGIRPRRWRWDTMLCAHALDSRPGISSIKFQAFVQLGVPAWDDKIAPYLESKGDSGNSPNRIKEVDLKTLLLYNGLDSLLEFLVAEIQAKVMGVML